MEISLFNPDGFLSAYGFACGYVQKVENEKLHKQMYREYNVYHVQSTKNNSPKLNSSFCGPVSHNYLIWESFEKLNDAKKLYNKIK